MTQDNSNKQDPYEHEIQPDPVHEIVQRLEVAGDKVVARIKELVREGNVRRVIVKTPEGKVLVDTPLSVGGAVMGTLTLFGALPLMLVSAGVAALAKVKVEVVREVSEGDIVEGDVNRVMIDVENSAKDDDKAE
jgi:DNA-binding Lrp family transcriptional regulator